MEPSCTYRRGFSNRSAVFPQAESAYKQKEQDYESDGGDMGSGASEDFSPRAHFNSEYSSAHTDAGREFWPREPDNTY